MGTLCWIWPWSPGGTLSFISLQIAQSSQTFDYGDSSITVDPSTPAFPW